MITRREPSDILSTTLGGNTCLPKLEDFPLYNKLFPNMCNNKDYIVIVSPKVNLTHKVERDNYHHLE